MLKLTSNPRNIARVESFVEKLVEKHKISPDIYGNILISLTEAVNNAITHGNSNDESKLVIVNLLRKENLLEFKVTDEGSGFDFNQLPDPTAPENLLKIGGRGVFLMRQLSDSIKFMNNGSCVKISFHI
ncbi:MAG TPA: ATP-binding protein [Bacteroidetes bacterium]|nr:ATP-binding protein [Bacteroidota bacterium]